MSSLDYQSWVAEALLSVVPRAVRLVAEQGLPEGHALYITFDTRHPALRVDEDIHRDYPEAMTVVLENQFWDLVAGDEGFSVVLAFGGRRKSLFVPWEAVRAFADPPAEFAFDTSGQVIAEARRLVGEESGDQSTDAEGHETPMRFAAGDQESRSPQSRPSPAGRVVPFTRPSETADSANESEEE